MIIILMVAEVSNSTKAPEEENPVLHLRPLTKTEIAATIVMNLDTLHVNVRMLTNRTLDRMTLLVTPIKHERNMSLVGNRVIIMHRFSSAIKTIKLQKMQMTWMTLIWIICCLSLTMRF